MSARALLVSVCLAVMATQPMATAQSCPEVLTQLELSVDHAPIELNNRISQAELTTMARSGIATLGHHARPLGLTTARLAYGFQFDLMANEQAGRVCAAPRQVTLRLGYDQMLVHILDRYRPGSCQYEAVYEHEQEHVRINFDTLQRYLPPIEAAVRRAIDTQFPVRAASTAEAEQMASRILSTALDQAVQVMLADRNARHQQLDSPDSYRWTANRCPTW